MKKWISLITITSLIFIGMELFLFFNPFVSRIEEINKYIVVYGETEDTFSIKSLSIPIIIQEALTKDSLVCQATYDRDHATCHCQDMPGL